MLPCFIIKTTKTTTNINRTKKNHHTCLEQALHAHTPTRPHTNSQVTTHFTLLVIKGHFINFVEK